MPGLAEIARKIAGAAIPQTSVVYGLKHEEDYGWLGSMRSADQTAVPREYIAAGTDFLYLPRRGTFKRRGGQVQKFDTFGAATGHLPAKWSAKSRWMDEFLSESISDGVPTLATLLTKETIASGLDDGRFSQLWVRDQVNSLNYTVGDEFSDTTYPEPGATPSIRWPAIWYESGDGGLTRGADEFSRRFLFSGSRRYANVGNWLYHPSRYGTPTRWNKRFTPASVVAALTATYQSLAVLNSGGGGDVGWAGPFTGAGGSGTTGTIIDALNTDDDNTKYAAVLDGTLGGNPCRVSLNGTIATGRQWLVTVKVRVFSPNTLNSGSFIVTLFDSAGNGFASSSQGTNASLAGLDSTWTFKTIAINGSLSPTTTGTANSINLSASGLVGAVSVHILTTYMKLEMQGATGFIEANRLIPSGPFPPTHAGTLVAGNMVAGSAGTSFARPNADSGVIGDGAWTDSGAGTSLFDQIDETTGGGAGDTDYIKDAGAPGAACGVVIADPGFVPTATTHTVRVSLRGSGDTFGAACTLQVDLMDDVTGTPVSRASRTFTAAELTNGGSTTARWISFDLTPAQITSVTQWADLGLKFTAGGTGGVRVYYAALELTAVGAALEGGWRGKDRFFYGVAYRFEDDSIWMPTVPRFANDLLTAGFQLFTVDAANTATAFDKVRWTNLPVPPNGIKSLVLLRTDKIESTTADNLQLDPFELFVVDEVSAGVTTYEDYKADDDALVFVPDPVDSTKDLFIRFDHKMTPRCRYTAAGDMRVVNAYGGDNPCAIIIAPVGRTADYDLNLADDSSTAYSESGSYMQITQDTAGAGTLTLIQSDGTTISDTLALAFATYDTLQKLVDRINATSCAVDGQQWRAQLCPDVDAQAPSNTSLLPHSRQIASCVVSGQTITKAAGGLAKVAVGAHISGTGATVGAYVSRIDSDTQLTFVGTITAATKTLTYYFELGDSPTTATADSGYQRVVANSLPGFLYFNVTYLATQTFDKAGAWMTRCSPGQAKCAANLWTTKTANRFDPPHSSGVVQNVAPIGHGFFIPYVNKRAVVRNTRDTGSGVDEDYRLQVVNEHSGCSSWNSVVPGSECASCVAPEGVYIVDLDGESLVSDRIWAHTTSDAKTGVGDFDYEMPLCSASAAADTDAQFIQARFMRSTLWVTFRASGSHPNRMVAYDFSAAQNAASGRRALLRPNGNPWGWSEPLIRSMTVMAEGHRSDGAHLYGWNDANAGSTGDGRVDEFETTDTDNGTAIAGTVKIPWERLGRDQKLSAQEIQLEHFAPAGSTGSLVFHRSYADDTYPLTPSTGTGLLRDPKMLPLPARAPTAACYIEYAQATGGAREIRKIVLRAKPLPSFT